MSFAKIKRAVKAVKQRLGFDQVTAAKNLYARVIEVDPVNSEAFAGLEAMGVKIDKTIGAAAIAQKKYTSPGPLFEELDLKIGLGKKPQAKILAYYLPQFHATEINNSAWGEGFTEWTNVARAVSRYHGQVQPRIPRDLGFYDLTTDGVMRRQADLAKAMGVHGFCFYHYFFDGKQYLEKPMHNLLKDKSIDIPFCIMWANENWTRTWDSGSNEVLIPQNYSPEMNTVFVDGLAEHFRDERYIRVEDRPLLFIYRAEHIPDVQTRIAQWRDLLFKRHRFDPLIYMVYRSAGVPKDYGMEGSIEFPPHRLWGRSKDISSQKVWIDPAAQNRVYDYFEASKLMLADGMPDHPHIKCVMPGWDNDARRPGRGTSFCGSTPELFAQWLDLAIQQAQAKPIGGETFVAINAWNEWAEGSMLEPDVYFGGAYLNALARTVFRP